MNTIFKRFRIDYLMYGGFSGVVVMLLSIVIWLTYTLSSQEMVRMTSFYQQGLLSELYNKIEIQMRSIEQLSLVASRNPIISEYSKNSEDLYLNYQKGIELEKYLASITYATPIIQSIDYYTKNDVTSTSQSPVSFYYDEKAKEENWFPVVENTDFAWIGEHRKKSFLGEISVISFARKIYSNMGTYQGLLVMDVKASVLQNLMRSETSDANRVLLDSGGRVITLIGDPSLQTMIMDYMTKMEKESGHLQARTSASGGWFSIPISHLIVWAKHSNNNWKLVELTPWSKITQGSLDTAVILSVVGVSATVISLLVTLLLSNQFLKPIRLLLREMGRYSGNIKKIDLPEDYLNEFGVLFLGYRKLMNRIHILYESLENQYKRQKRAEIKALQAMINPHFLYNTLDQLNWMALVAGQDKLSRILELMGKMFRIGLSNGESMITFREELIHAECYMQIQQLCWEEGLTFRMDVPDNIKDRYIPKMTLQPFIENSIIHGFNERTHGKIEIEVREAEEEIFISITDDGSGLIPNWNTTNKVKTGGFGIRNVRERFEAFFGDRFHIEIKNNEYSSGAMVIIRLPVVKTKEPETMGKSVI